MSADDLDHTVPTTEEAVWLEVGQVSRSVDRQLECLRSILAAADAGLAEGPLGELVRGTTGYVTGRLAGLPPGPAGAGSIGGAVLRSLAAISALASRSLSSSALVVLTAAPPDGAVRAVDLVGSVVDEIIDRYRSLVAEIGVDRPVPVLVARTATAAPLELYVEQLGTFRSDPDEDAAVLGGAVQLVGIWLLIAVHIAEARAWVQAHQLVDPIDAADEPRMVRS